MKKISNKNILAILAILVIVTIFVLLFSYFYFTKKQTENFQQSDIEEMKQKITNMRTHISTIPGTSQLNSNFLNMIEQNLNKSGNITCDSSGNCILNPTAKQNIKNLLANQKGGLEYYITNRLGKNQLLLNDTYAIKTSLNKL